jgi:hypothetical protein
MTCGPGGLTDRRIDEIFYERLHLQKGEFLVKASVESVIFRLLRSCQENRNEKFDYPLFTTAGIHGTDSSESRFRPRLLSVQGPGRGSILNDGRLGFCERAKKIAQHLSASYCATVRLGRIPKIRLKNTLVNVLEILGGQPSCSA